MANRVTRRQFMTRTGLAMGGIVARPAAARGVRWRRRGSSGAPVGLGPSAFENWPEYIDQPDDELYGAGGTLDDLPEGQRPHDQVHRGLQRQQRVLRQDPAAAVQGRADRAEHHRPDLLAGRPPDPARLGREAPARARSPTRRTCSSRSPSRRRTRPASTRCRGSRAWPASPTTRGHRAASSRTIERAAASPELKGKVGMLTEMRDTVGADRDAARASTSTSRRSRSSSPRSTSSTEAEQDGQVRQFTGNDYIDDLENGNFAACIAWSGDVAAAVQDNPDIGFVDPRVPAARSWFDTMVIPAGASNTDAVGRVDGLRVRPGQRRHASPRTCSTSPRCRACRTSCARWAATRPRWPTTR